MAKVVRAYFHHMGYSVEERTFVRSARVARLATADDAGRPHAVPLCFSLLDDRLVSVIDEKPKRAGPHTLKRIRNIQENPAVAVLIDRYAEQWDRLGWVRIDGRASVWEPSHPQHDDAISLLRRKYSQYETQELADRPLIAIEPTHVVSWGTLEWE